MSEPIDVRELYLSVVGSLDDANQQLEKMATEREFSYIVTDLEFSIPFRELSIEGGQVLIDLEKEDDENSVNRNLKFKVRFIPQTTIQEFEEEKPEISGVLVPDLINKTFEDAKKIIVASELVIGKVSYDPDIEPVGSVISQIPLPLTAAETGQEINLLISGESPGPTPPKKRRSPSKRSPKK